MKETHTAFILPGMLALAAVILVSGCGEPAGRRKAAISVVDNAILYTGDINEKNTRTFAARLAANPDVDTLIVNSQGGDTDSGRQIGRLVFDRQLDVRVEGRCFSSCANYIFPAGRDKHIAAGSYVGWHGNDHQAVILAELEGITTEEYIKQVLAEALAESGNYARQPVPGGL